MGKINIAIKDETEEKFRQAVGGYMGAKKGNLSRAMEEAINLWIDHVSKSYQRKHGKEKIKW
jgi:hypothetical protein